MSDTIFDPLGLPRKPGIIIIGAQKAGTSWLTQMLAQHPQVWATPIKEAQFFNHLFIPGHRYWIDWHWKNKPQELRDRFKRRGREMLPELSHYLTRVSTAGNRYTRSWYLDLFQPAPAYALPMEATPEYSQLPEEGVAFMAGWLPQTRFIYLIRDPASRAVSQLRMNLAREKRRPATETDWFAEVDNPVLDERGDYATYLDRWQRHAGDRLMVMPYGLISQAPLPLLEEIEAFCGLDRWDYANPRVKVWEGPADITVPETAVARLRKRLRPQYDYLADTLGPDFLALTT